MAVSVASRLKFGRLALLFEQSRILTALHLRKSFIQHHPRNEWKRSQHSSNPQRVNIFSLSFTRGFTSSSNSSSTSKVVQFKLSDIGEGIREVSVKEWFVKVGDRVAQFDSICEVQSDKASVTITSRYDGIVTKLYHDVDDIAFVGQPLVDIQLHGEGGGDMSSTDDIVESRSSEDSSSSSEESDDDDDDHSEIRKVLATPAVRNFASQGKVDLSSVPGSGKHGRILKEDVLNFMKEATEFKTVIPEIEISEGEESFVPKSLPPLPKFAGVPEDRTETIAGMRKAMVKSMIMANTIPHFCFCDEINLNNLVDLKPKFKEVAGKYGVKFSYTSVFVKAASVALSEFPLLNSSVDPECRTITYRGAHNIGFAVDSPFGLIVPNIKNVGQLSILEVASELGRLMQLGASGKLGPSDLSGGTFTLSNIGTIGGTYTKPLIFAPQVVIGALGSISKHPRFDENDNIVPTHLMNVSWSADHRVVDGATVARFNNLWKSYLEDPASLLLHLK